jgi:hypothetical protein
MNKFALFFLIVFTFSFASTLQAAELTYSPSNPVDSYPLTFTLQFSPEETFDSCDLEFDGTRYDMVKTIAYSTYSGLTKVGAPLTHGDWTVQIADIFENPSTSEWYAAVIVTHDGNYQNHILLEGDSYTYGYNDEFGGPELTVDLIEISEGTYVTLKLIEGDSGEVFVYEMQNPLIGNHSFRAVCDIPLAPDYSTSYQGVFVSTSSLSIYDLLINPLAPTCIDNIYFSVNTTIDSGCILGIGGNTYGMSSSHGIYHEVSVWPPLSPSMYAYYITCDDYQGNIDQISDDLEVQSYPLLDIYGLRVTPVELTNTAPFTVYANTTRDAICYLNIDGSRQRMTHISNQEFYYTVYFLSHANTAGGDYPLVVECSDSCGTNTLSDSVTLTDLVAPNIYRVELNPLVPSETDEFTLHAFVTEEASCELTFDDQIYSMNYEGKNLADEDTFNFTLGPFEVGTHSYSINCTDLADYDSIIHKTLEIGDNTFPIIHDFDYSPSELNDLIEITFEINTSDNIGVSYCVILVGNSEYLADNLGEGIWSKSLKLQEGTYSLSAQCTDYAENRVTDSLQDIVVEKILAPVVGSLTVLPATPTNLEDVMFNVSATDVHGIESCKLILNDETFEMFIEGESWLLIQSQLQFGSHEAYVNCSNIWGLSNVSEPVAFNVLDKIKPIVDPIQYSPTSPESGSTVIFSLTAEDNDKVSSCKLMINGQVNEMSLSSNLWTYSQVLEEGSYFILANCSDTSGNYKETSSLTLDIEILLDILSVSVDPTSPTMQDNVQIKAQTNVNENTECQTHLIGPGVDTYSTMYLDSTDWTTPQIQLPKGTYTATVQCTRGGYLIQKDKVFTVLDESSPIISNFAVNPQSPTNKENFVISFSATDNTGVSQCTFSYKKSSDSWKPVQSWPNGGNFQITFGPHEPGTYYAKAECSDTSQNSAAQTINFNVIDNSMTVSNIQIYPERPTDDQKFYVEADISNNVGTTYCGMNLTDFHQEYMGFIPMRHKSGNTWESADGGEHYDIGPLPDGHYHVVVFCVDEFEPDIVALEKGFYVDFDPQHPVAEVQVPTWTEEGRPTNLFFIGSDDDELDYCELTFEGESLAKLYGGKKMYITVQATFDFPSDPYNFQFKCRDTVGFIDQNSASISTIQTFPIVHDKPMIDGTPAYSFGNYNYKYHTLELRDQNVTCTSTECKLTANPNDDPSCYLLRFWPAGYSSDDSKDGYIQVCERKYWNPPKYYYEGWHMAHDDIYYTLLRSQSHSSSVVAPIYINPIVMWDRDRLATCFGGTNNFYFGNINGYLTGFPTAPQYVGNTYVIDLSSNVTYLYDLAKGACPTPDLNNPCCPYTTDPPQVDISLDEMLKIANRYAYASSSVNDDFPSGGSVSPNPDIYAEKEYLLTTDSPAYTSKSSSLNNAVEVIYQQYSGGSLVDISRLQDSDNDYAFDISFTNKNEASRYTIDGKYRYKCSGQIDIPNINNGQGLSLVFQYWDPVLYHFADHEFCYYTAKNVKVFLVDDDYDNVVEGITIGIDYDGVKADYNRIYGRQPQYDSNAYIFSIVFPMMVGGRMATILKVVEMAYLSYEVMDAINEKRYSDVRSILIDVSVDVVLDYLEYKAK